MDHTTHSARGQGVDQARESRPGVPMETQPAHEANRTMPRITQQESQGTHLHRKDLDGLTPVYGTGPQPGRSLSGVMRRAAYGMPEYQTRRWMLLLAADRVDMLEHRVPELVTGRSWDALARQVRANPVGMLGMAFGMGFLLQRTRVLPALASAVGSAVFSRDIELDPLNHSPAEQKLLEWLNDAYAMELAIVPVLENHADDAKRHPEIRNRDLQHLKETKQHAKDVKRCIEHLGGKPSATKKTLGRISGAMQSMATEPFADEIMKNFLSDYATEHFEIACYRSLVIAANEAGHPKIASVCEEILQEELDMAEWIEENMHKAVQLTLN